MNKFEQAYLNIINEWNSNLLLEANLKSLIPNIQQKLIGNRTYSELTDKEKENLQNDIKLFLDTIKDKVNEITDNKQYQSWIYTCLKNNEINLTPNNVNKLKSLLLEFTRLCKRPDLKPNQRNIENYKSFNDLFAFVDSFKEEHKLQSNIYKNLKKIYSNDEFTVYFINSNQYEECNKLFGGNEYFNTGWCIAKNKEHFNRYIQDEQDKYNGYFVFIKDNKPFALLHYGSQQFKDTSDKTLKTDNLNVIDCLYHINNNLDNYNKNDLKYYKNQIFLKENPNATKEDLIAFEIGGEYDLKTNTIDCKGNYVHFKNEWLDENGTFNFNLINTSNNWNYMFYTCSNLLKLPDNFKIPENIKYCTSMFSYCINLKELPNNFTIPNNVQRCDLMFYECKKLKELPKSFTIPENSSYKDIFYYSGLEGKYNPKDLLR